MPKGEASPNQDLDKFLSELSKKFPQFSTQVEEDDLEGIPRIPTQSEQLNKLLGGGIPVNRITEIYGPEHTGKSSLGYGVIAEVQKLGGRGALIDLEGAYDPPYLAEVIGVDLVGRYQPKNWFYQPPTVSGEEAMDLIEALIRSHQYNAIVVDSVAAISPEAELKASAADQFIGRQAALMSKCMRKFVNALHDSNCALIFINQERVAIGQYSPTGTPTTTPGGKALRFYASIRIEVRKAKDLKVGEIVIGHELKLKAIKNRGHKPKANCGIDVYYGRGIDRVKELSELAVEHGAVRQAAAWISVVSPDTGEVASDASGEPLKWHGFPKFVEYLAGDVALQQQIMTVVHQGNAPSLLPE